MKKIYQQVSCALHSELELMIMHEKKLELSIKNESGTKKILLKPYDLETRKDKAEYLLGKGEHDTLYAIRLDQIINVTAK